MHNYQKGADTHDNRRSDGKNYKQEIIDLRRTFHEHPELSFEEVETTKRIAAILDNWGIPYEINPDKHVGLVAKLTGGHPGESRSPALGY